MYRAGALAMWQCHGDIEVLGYDTCACVDIQNSGAESTRDICRCIYTPNACEIIAGPFVCVCAVGGCYRRCGELFVSIDWGRGQYDTVWQAAPEL